MKILWIPHASWVGGGRVRSWSFIEKMRQKHEIHVLTWTSPSQNNILHFLNPKLHLDGLRNWDDENNGIYLHHYGRFHNVRFTPFLLSLNQKKFQSKIRNIVLNYKIDVIICGVNHYLNGFPPFDLKIPVVLDIIDFYPYKKALETYFNKSAAILCLSHKLLEEALINNKNSYYLPPAINLDKARSGCPDRVRQKYNLDGYKIVSLIGLTISPSLYLFDTIPLVKEVIPDVKYLIVGDSHLLPKMKRKVGNSKDVIFTGWVNIDNIQDYFFASDVGTYPGDEDPFFTNTVATKVLEYAAARKPVVSSDVLELKLWSLPNVLISPPNAKDFAQNIINALTMDFKYSSLDEFQDKNLINNLEKILKSVL
jgi:glycosyltransferase involved in cell wall biosynthesis